MIIKQYTLGVFDTNTFIIVSDDKQAVIIDPADNGFMLLHEVEKLGAELKMILITHGHYDHTKAAAYLQNETGVPVYVHTADTEMLQNVNKALPFGIIPDFQPVKNILPLPEEITLSDLTFKIVNTPGHTEGSCMLFIDDAIFTGDTLFKGSVGNTWGNLENFERLIQSVQFLKKLDKDYRIFAGHGENTGLSRELKYNEFLR
jgi:glyoxylase-like metal-dependent hydrolase (beta-lactamase superfamily II)